MPDYHAVLTDASQLTVEERLRLIEALSSSVPEECPPALSQDWLTEVKRRSGEIDAGLAATEDWSRIRDRLFAKHGIRHAD